MHVLLLSGGAFKGAVQIASIRALLNEMGRLPDEIRGTSVGAVNGVMVAQNRIDELVEIWTALDDPNPINGVRGFLRATPLAKDGFWSLDPLREQLVEREVKTQKLRTRFGAGIWLPESDLHVVPTWTSQGPDNHRVELEDGVLASAAICGMFAGIPVTWNAARSIAGDGGHEHVCPPVPSWVKPGDRVDAIFCHPLEPGVIMHTAKQVDGRIERLLLAADKGTHAPARGDFETLKALAASGVDVRVRAPRQDPGPMLDASRATIARRLHVIGEEMAREPIWTTANGATPRES
jgi:predicted acylesterase/phospholipase RssA